jgi:hypothetical protein
LNTDKKRKKRGKKGKWKERKERREEIREGKERSKREKGERREGESKEERGKRKEKGEENRGRGSDNFVGKAFTPILTCWSGSPSNWNFYFGYLNYFGVPKTVVHGEFNNFTLNSGNYGGMEIPEVFLVGKYSPAFRVSSSVANTTAVSFFCACPPCPPCPPYPPCPSRPLLSLLPLLPMRQALPLKPLSPSPSRPLISLLPLLPNETSLFL